MITEHRLAETLRQIHDKQEVGPGEGSPLPALFTELDIDPNAAFSAAEQVALRVLTASAGRVIPRDEFTAEQQTFASYMAAAFLDGLAAGKSLGAPPNFESVTKNVGEIRELVEAAYVNSGLSFDSLRKIGNLVGADPDKIGG